MRSSFLAGGTSLPFGEGARSEAVVDLQSRLVEAGIPVDDEQGCYGASTARAVALFQKRRGLAASGICDMETWSTLVEAGYRLGSRLLYRREPMIRGDDVAELQRKLSSLGFDPGRIDGIFGDETTSALMEFQRNAGLPLDGKLGRETLADLERLAVREGGSDLVSPLRERLQVAGRGLPGLIGRRIGVGETGGFSTGALAVARALRAAGAVTLVLHDPDPSHQAIAANTARVDCFIGLRLTPEHEACVTSYYAGFRYESIASRRLAELIQPLLVSALKLGDRGTHGMALPILRETRMPAVEVELGSPELVIQQTVELAKVLVAALESWTSADFE